MGKARIRKKDYQNTYEIYEFTPFWKVEKMYRAIVEDVRNEKIYSNGLWQNFRSVMTMFPSSPYEEKSIIEIEKSYILKCFLDMKKTILISMIMFLRN